MAKHYVYNVNGVPIIDTEFDHDKKLIDAGKDFNEATQIADKFVAEHEADFNPKED